MQINKLAISWATSRGRDTYGYNICRLDDRDSGKRYRTCGGGYDMIGTVFSEWLAECYQSELKALVSKRSNSLIDCGYSVKGYKKLPDLYGLTVSPNGTVQLDGACGISSIISIAEAIDLKVEREGNRKGETVGYYVYRDTNAH